MPTLVCPFILFVDTTVEGVWTSGVCPNDTHSDCEWTSTSERVDYQYRLSGTKGICISIIGKYPYKWKKETCDMEFFALCESPKQGKPYHTFALFFIFSHFGKSI